MKCTKCGQRVKPVVAIDIDGTLADYHSHFLRFISGYLNAQPGPDSHYAGGISFREWTMATYGIDERTWRDAKLAYRQGAQKRSVPPYSGYNTPIRVARESGCEVWLTTTRPYLRLDGVDPDTRFWLDIHGLHYDGLLYDEDKYRVLADRVDPGRVIMVLDDLPEQYDAADEVFPGKAVFRKNEYNKAVERPIEVHDLWEAAELIRLRTRQWLEDYE